MHRPAGPKNVVPPVQVGQAFDVGCAPRLARKAKDKQANSPSPVDGDESPRLGWDRGGGFSNITIFRSRGYVEFNCFCGLGLSPGVRSGVRDEPGRQGPDEPTV